MSSDVPNIVMMYLDLAEEWHKYPQISGYVRVSLLAKKVQNGYAELEQQVGDQYHICITFIYNMQMCFM